MSKNKKINKVSFDFFNKSPFDEDVFIDAKSESIVYDEFSSLLEKDDDSMSNTLEKIFKNDLTPKEIYEKTKKEFPDVNELKLNEFLDPEKTINFLKSEYAFELLAEKKRRIEQERLELIAIEKKKIEEEKRLKRVSDEEKRRRLIAEKKKKENEEIENARLLAKQRELLQKEKMRKMAEIQFQKEESLRIAKKINALFLSKLKLDFGLFEKNFNKCCLQIKSDFLQKRKKLEAHERKRKEQLLKKMRIKSFFVSFFDNYHRLSDNLSWSKNVWVPAKPLVKGSIGIFLFIFVLSFSSYAFQLKESIKVKGENIISHLYQAKSNIKNGDFLALNDSFEGALSEFDSINKNIDILGGDALNVFESLPYLSRISSGKHLLEAGNDLTKAAYELSRLVSVINKIENPFNENSDNGLGDVSFLTLLSKTLLRVSSSKELLVSANNSLESVKIEDIPAEYQAKVLALKKGVPASVSLLESFEDNSKILFELLGQNGPRKYLFLFQNNHEMRATGGFIGSYGVLHISDGQIEKLFIDGIFNPDGQLKDNIIPPQPIKKMSAAWSMHDANWFPDFPSSAKKIASFYEKTGGPTVDGILAMTPTVLKKMLSITGPIDMPEYDVVVDDENFMEVTQYKVEVDYDKEENRPKKFVADLAPKILNELLNSGDIANFAKTVDVLIDALRERHVLLYSVDEDVQSLIESNYWGGRILPARKDYFMLVNSNVNGFKTDGIINQKIYHEVEILADGSVVDTVRIKRTHNGGDSEYDWWNRVNSNYMRVYVPLGSELLSVEGQTREFVKDPIDYNRLGFKFDSDIKKQEDSMLIHDESGTRIYEENGKTVFANWTYVSPKETVEVEYKYVLPFKIDLNKNEEGVDSYSLLLQKQSGDENTDLNFKLNAGELNGVTQWKYPDFLVKGNNFFEKDMDFEKDIFFAWVFQDSSLVE